MRLQAGQGTNGIGAGCLARLTDEGPHILPLRRRQNGCSSSAQAPAITQRHLHDTALIEDIRPEAANNSAKIIVDIVGPYIALVEKVNQESILALEFFVVCRIVAA